MGGAVRGWCQGEEGGSSVVPSHRGMSAACRVDCRRRQCRRRDSGQCPEIQVSRADAALWHRANGNRKQCHPCCVRV